jgi:hypothetical protein
MLFATEVYVSTLAEQEQGQAGDHDKSKYELPHFSTLQKKYPKKSPRHMDDEGPQNISNITGKSQGSSAPETGAGRWARPAITPISRWRKYPRPWFP